MACLSFTLPELNQTDPASVATFYKIIDDKMVEAGLIRSTLPSSVTISDSFITNQQIVHYDQTTFQTLFSSTAIKATGVYGSNQYIASMVYELPVGDGSTEYINDTIDPTYKRVNRSSYDSTKIKFAIHIMLLNINSTSNSLIRYRILHNMSVIYVGDNLTMQPYYIGTGLRYVNNTSWNISAYGISGQSFISLTDNSLSVMIGRQNHSSSGVTPSYPDFNKYMIKFHLYRNSGDVCLYYVGANLENSNSGTAYLNITYADVNCAYYNKENKTFTNSVQTSSAFLYWPIQASNAITNGSLNIGQVYASDGLKIMYVPYFFINKRADAEHSIIEQTYMKDGNKVIGRFVNMGASERAFLPYLRTNLNYNWAFLYEEGITYTTESVGS